MKRIKIPLFLILGLAITTGIILTIHTVLTPKQLGSEKAHSVYTNATELLNLNSYTYQISETKTMQVNSLPIRISTQQTLQYFAKDTEQFEGNVSEEIIIGNQRIQSTEFLSDNTFYGTTGEHTFSGPMSQDDFLARYTPFLLIDPQLYKTIYGTKSHGVYTLLFSEASAPEAWAELGAVEFLHAEGSAIINADGFLKESSYTCEYMADGIPVKLTVTTRPCSEAYGLGCFEKPLNTIRINDPTAPKLLEIACGYLLAASAIDAEYTDEIYCQAFDDRRTQSISLKSTPSEAEVITHIILQNGSKIGPQSDILKKESFRDGRYTISINDSEPTEDPQISSEKMKTYCQNILIGTIMLSEHISNVTVSQSENSVKYIFTGSESFTTTLKNDACHTLYQDSDILTEQTQGYTTETATFYLEVDTITTLPKASGFLYKGVYTSDGLPYQLDYRAEQTYDLQ